MNEVLGIGLQSMHGDIARLEQIAHNMANMMSPAHKRGLALQPALVTGFAAQLARADVAAAPGVQPHAATAVDMRPGTLKATGRALDVALTGAGFFEVMTDAGLAYTRRGDFEIDARGRLVTQQGHAVMGVEGEIVMNGSAPVIAADGTVANAGAPPGADSAQHLKVVDFDDPSSMTPLGAGLFAPGVGLKPTAGAQVQMRQGYLENSNVSSADEMTRLLQVMRHFESMQKMVVGYDDMLGAAIRKLGETQ